MAVAARRAYGGSVATTERADEARILARALDQAGDVLDHVHPDRLALPTPCGEWDVSALADHLADAPRRFLTMVQGGQPDWSAPPPHLTEGWGATFRVAADDLIHACHEQGDGIAVPLGMEIAELATHAWDLGTALGRPAARLEAELDPEVAEAGLAFMRASLTAEMRGSAFGPEQPAAEGAGPYARLAAFAGRMGPV